MSSVDLVKLRALAQLAAIKLSIPGLSEADSKMNVVQVLLYVKALELYTEEVSPPFKQAIREGGVVGAYKDVLHIAIDVADLRAIDINALSKRIAEGLKIELATADSEEELAIKIDNIVTEVKPDESKIH